MAKVKTITCEEALKQVFEYIDKELDAHKHDEMEHHLSICRSCFSRLEFEKHLRSHVQKISSEDKASEELKGRIKNLIRKI